MYKFNILIILTIEINKLWKTNNLTGKINILLKEHHVYIIYFLEAKNVQVGDLFAGEAGFQQPAIPPIRRTKRQASIVCIKRRF